MSEIGKVQGPSGSPDLTHKKESISDPKKFEEVRKRVDAVSAVDPDEHKKRRQQEEPEENLITLPEEPALLAPPPPFFLIQETPPADLLDIKIPSTSSTASSLASSAPAPESPEISPEQTTEQESLFSSAPPNASYPPITPSSSSTASSPTQKSASTTNPSSSPQKPPSQKTALTQPFTAAEWEKPIEDVSALLKQMPLQDQPLLKQIEPPKESNSEDSAVIDPFLPPLPPVFTGEKEKKIDSLEASLLVDSGLISPLETPPLITPLESKAAISPYVRLPLQAQELFEKIVGVMTVMNLQGSSETSFTLNNPKFAASVFFGAQIIIKEFSTAPQAFNVQLNGSMQAVALFQSNANDLMAAFQAGNYNFKINRFETSYSDSERPVFKRKEEDTNDSDKEHRGQHG